MKVRHKVDEVCEYTKGTRGYTETVINESLIQRGDGASVELKKFVPLSVP